MKNIFDEPVFKGAVSAPVLDEDATLNAAIARMRRANRKCVVVRREGADFQIHAACDLTKALHAGTAAKLRDLVGLTVHVADPSLPKHLAIDGLKNCGAKFGLLSPPAAGSRKAEIYVLDDETSDYVEDEPGDQKKKGGKRP